MKYLFFALLVVVTVFGLSPEPVPSCSSPRYEINDVPIALNEVQQYNLDEYFTGFNLQFNLSSSAPDFVYLAQKTDVVKNFNKSQPGLKSHHLEYNGNEWGRNLITLSEVGFTTIIRWGSASPNETVPELTENVTVQNQKSIWCFDAIWMRDEHIAIVDCVQSVAFGLQNIFYYVNTTSQTLLPTIKNDMYAPFTKITRRRMVLLRQQGYNYLIRAYFADSVDHDTAHNTYLQILTFIDPFKPRTLKVMDRSYLHQDKLSITDFKLYMGNMYLLDYHSGVIVFDITPSQNILITGRYRSDSGFRRLGVYSGNLDNHILFALATDHAIYQIDFTNQLRPEIITKYSIFSNSTIQSVWVNEQYVLAQITANVTTTTNSTVWYNSTIVFSRGTRTYLNAYEIYQHNTTNVVLDFQRDQNLLLVIEESYMRLYRLNKPVVSIRPTNPATLNKEFSFTVMGLSINTYNNHSLVCSYTFKFVVVNINSTGLWPTGRKLPDVYYANFPGELFIPLDRYVFGPNITWGIHEDEHPNMSTYWILQQNHTIIHWEKEPSLGKITFLRQQQFDSIARTDLWLYTQDSMNITHFVRCETVPYTEDVHCRDGGYIPDVHWKINNLTAHRYDQYEGYHVHLVAVVYEQLPNEVFIYEAETKKQIVKPIIFTPDPYEGLVTNVEFVGHYLAILQRYTKQILFYDMKACVDHQEGQCKEVYRIDSRTMNFLGVNYFAPMDIYVSDFHPWVLFIQNVDRVIIISVTRTGPRLLAQIESPGSKQPGHFKFKIAITQDHLILVNPPNIIEEHSLEQLYTKKDAPMNKVYPVYDYVIPDKFDLDFSDAGNLIYITAIDKNMPNDHNSVILVYRAGYPAISAFYDVFNVYFKYEDMLIDATGNFGDYVSVALGSMLLMFRQYEFPVLVFQNNFHDYDFNLTYTNDPHSEFRFLARSSVKVANYPQDIIVNDARLNNSQFLTSQIKYENDKKRYILNDTNWFNGSVINYTMKGCDECGNKIKVVNHVEEVRDLHASMDMDDYVFTFDGGIIQQFQSMIKMRHNGSIDQYISMPAVLDGENCRTITHNWMYEFAVSACQHLDQVYLYMTNLVNSKPFVNGPHPSTAKRVAGMQTQGDIFILVDVDEQPSNMSREGGVLVYALNHDITQPELFDQLDFIDTDDLIAANGWTFGDRIFIGNAHLVFTNESQIYRLAITELRNGVFFVDFKWKPGMKQLEILKIEFMNLRQQLITAHLPMPNVAFFEGVTVSSQYYDPTFKYWDVQLIVTTRNFHIFQVNCYFDQTGTLVDHKIAKVFYRYGYYETSNYIKTFDGYFVVVQKLPVIYQPFPWLSRQVLTVYDTKQRWRPMQEDDEQANSKKIAIKQKPAVKYANDVPGYYMLGGMVLRQGRVTFDFNFTFRRNESDPFINIGLLVLNSRQAVIRQVNIHDHIEIITEQGIMSTQNAKLVAFNDYSTKQLPLNIVIDNGGTSGLPGWAIALIVIGSIALAALGGFVGWKFYLKKRSQSPDEAPIKKSLLQEEVDKDQQDDDDDDDDDDQDDDDDEIEVKPAPVVTSQPKTNVGSINRQTLESVDGQGAVTQPGQKPVQQTPKVEQAPKTEQSPKVEEPEKVEEQPGNENPAQDEKKQDNP